MELSIVVVSYNTCKITVECLKSVVKYTRGIDFEILVIDNGSTDNSVSAIKKLQIDSLHILENKENVGFGRANNQGLKLAKGNFILLLNSDTELKSNVVADIVGFLKANPKVGIASCLLCNKDGSVQGTGGYFPTLIRVLSWMTIQDVPGVDLLIKPFHPLKSKSPYKANGFYSREKELDWLTGAFFLVRKAVVDDIGYFDEDYFMYTEEVDYCYRAKRSGWLVYFLPKWSITHFGGASGTKEMAVLGEFSGLKTFYRKHYPAWQFPVLRLLLKIGSLGRILLFGILEGKESAAVYAKAFRSV